MLQRLFRLLPNPSCTLDDIMEATSSVIAYIISSISYPWNSCHMTHMKEMIRATEVGRHWVFHCFYASELLDGERWVKIVLGA